MPAAEQPKAGVCSEVLARRWASLLSRIDQASTFDSSKSAPVKVRRGAQSSPHTTISEMRKLQRSALGQTRSPRAMTMKILRPIGNSPIGNLRSLHRKYAVAYETSLASLEGNHLANGLDRIKPSVFFRLRLKRRRGDEVAIVCF